MWFPIIFFNICSENSTDDKNLKVSIRSVLVLRHDIAKNEIWKSASRLNERNLFAFLETPIKIALTLENI
jgi:hypothetical protein